MSATLRIETLGRCAVVVGERRIEPSAEMVFAGLMLLGLERGRSWSRTEIAEMLWPGVAHSTQGSRLRWLLAKLRGLGLRIENNSAEVTVAPSDVAIDVDEIEHLPLETIGDVLSLPAALRSTRFPEPFVAWLERQRAALRADALRRLRSHLQTCMTREAWHDAISVATAMRRMDPLEESAALSLAESLFRLGSKAAAVAIIERHMADCGDITPESHLKADLLLRRIRSVQESHELSAEPRFIGRTEELKRIDALLFDARNGEGHALMLAGPPGIGKTRLLDEARSRAMMAGMQVIRIRCQRGDAIRPLSGIADLVPQLLSLRGAAGCDPVNLERLRAFSNPRSPENSAGDGESSASPAVQRARLTRALIDALEAVSSEAPLLLQIDDSQWADKSLKWLWDSLLAASQAFPVAWIFAFRTSRHDIPSLPIPVVHLGSLDLAAAAELVTDFARLLALPIDADVRTAILARGAGSPLFIRELTRQWKATGLTDALPTSLVGLIDRGLAGHSKHALRVLQVAAVLGTNATLDRIEQICGFVRPTFIDALIELEVGGILAAERNGQTFGHVLWAEAALGQLSTSIAGLLHRNAAEQLEAELAVNPVARLVWESARHWEIAGRPDRAQAAIVRGAEHLAGNGFPADAAAAYLRAEHMVGDPRQKLALLRRRIDLLMVVGSFRELDREIDRHEALASELDLGYYRHNELETMRFDVGFLIAGRFDESLAGSTRCLGDSSNPPSHRLDAALQAAKGAFAIAPNRLEEINQVAQGIPAVSFRDRWAQLRVRSLFERKFGDIKALPAIDDALESLAREQDSEHYLVRALHSRGQTAALMGRFTDARADHMEAARLAGQRGFFEIFMLSYEQLIGLSLDIGSPAETRQLLDEAKRLSSESVTSDDAPAAVIALSWHEANLAAIEGRFEDALALVRPLAECLAERVALWRVRHLAIQLAARVGLGRLEGLEEIVQSMRAAFEFPGDWLDWPATVCADYLARFVGVDEAARFARRYITEVRRELYPPPARLMALANADATPSKSVDPLEVDHS